MKRNSQKGGTKSWGSHEQKQKEFSYSSTGWRKIQTSNQKIWNVVLRERRS